MKIDQCLSTAGERLRRARFLAGLTTRREFEKKYNISANTLQGWEQGKNPLSEKGARRVIEAFKAEGLICSVEWLIHGNGMPPRPFEMLHNGNRNMDIQEEQSIYQEIQTFKQNSLNPIVINITDDALEPYFTEGDYVGGTQVYGEEISKYIGQPCIVELENHMILPRYVHRGNLAGLYNLSFTNPKTRSPQMNNFNVKLISAAPIIWHRRKLAAVAAVNSD